MNWSAFCIGFGTTAFAIGLNDGAAIWWGRKPSRTSACLMTVCGVTSMATGYLLS